MYIRKELITPEIAKQLLETNYKNRNIRENVVRSLADKISSGEFVEDSPNMISIDTNGRLIDGQHRLSAIVKSGISLNLYIARDVSNNSVIDRGMPRAMQDSLYMRGEIGKEYANRSIISIAKNYIAIKRGYGDGRRVKDSEIVKLINEYGEYLLNSLSLSNKGGHGTSRILRRQYYQSAIFAALVKGVSYSRLDRFCTIANTGFCNDETESAAILLRNYALKSTATGILYANKVDHTKVCEMAIRDFKDGVPRRIMYRTIRHVYIDVEGD